MKIYLKIILFINITFALGIKAVNIPQSANIVSCSSTGISLIPELNPANLSNSKGYFTASNNNWLVDVKGQKLSLLFNTKKDFIKSYLSIETLSDRKLELRNYIPNDEPLGYFGVYWYAFEIAQSIRLNKDASSIKTTSIGYRLKFNLSKIYYYKMYGYLVDFGFTRQISNRLSVAFVIKNIGKQYSDDLYAEDLKSYVVGTNYLLDNIKLNILSDFQYQKNELTQRYSVRTNFKYFNVIFGRTISDSYKDISYGFIIKIGSWSVIYGAIENENSSLGTPTSIELKKYF